ncbi:MAG: carbonic anhydrase [Magnetospirillum sp. WYHS-4]
MAVIGRLIAGFKGFRAKYFEQRPDLFADLAARGQAPGALVVACSDSRVDPAILLNAEPGELFVVRNVANLVPPYQPDGHYHGTSAAVEFAVRDLGVRHVIVLGHSHCGGIAALHRTVTGAEPEREFIAPWVSIVSGALESAHGAACGLNRLEQAAICVSLSNLRTFPWVTEALAGGTLALHGWWFDMGRGELWAADESQGVFNRLA